IAPTNNDGDLPPDVSKSAWDVQFGEVTFPLVGSWFLGVYGYGPAATDGTNAGILNVNFNKPMPLNANSLSLDSSLSLGNPGAFALCKGDSGGPMFRQVANGQGGFNTIIVGINSAGGPEGLCGNGFDHNGNPQTSLWSRVDVVANVWLRDTLRFFKMGQDWSPTVLPDGAEPRSYAKMH